MSTNRVLDNLTIVGPLVVVIGLSVIIVSSVAAYGASVFAVIVATLAHIAA